MAERPYTSSEVCNLGSRKRIFRPVRVNAANLDVEVEVEVFSGEAAPFLVAHEASDEATIPLALQVAGAIAREKGANAERAIYVIAGETLGISKIGVASNPRKRLMEIQVGHWESLRIACLFWVYGPETIIEQRALKAVADQGLALNGEWGRLSPEEAALLVAETIQASSIPCASSAMWLRNRAKVANARAQMAARLMPDRSLDYVKQPLGDRLLGAS